MPKKVIAIDIDEVLADWYHFALPKLNNILNTSKSIEGVKFVPFKLEKFFGKSHKEMERALKKMYREAPITEMPPVKGSQKAINKLSKKFKLIAVTARPKRFWKETRFWVHKHFNSKIEVYFGTGAGNPSGGENHINNKLEICRNKKALYIIEDNPSEILVFIDTEIMPICFAWPWNKQITQIKKIVRGRWTKITNFLLRQV